MQFTIAQTRKQPKCVSTEEWIKKTECGLPCWHDSKQSACNADSNLCSIPGSGRSPGEGMATRSSILVWRITRTEEAGGATVRGVSKSRTWRAKEDVVPTDNWILIIKKEQKNVICRDMDRPRCYHTKWSKSEKDIWYHSYVESSLKKRYKWAYIQNRNTLTDFKNKLMDTKGDCRAGGIH